MARAIALTFAATFVLAAMLVPTFGATEASARTLTVTSQYGPGKPQTLLWERFAEILEAERPGAYEVRIVTGGALGGEKEEAEAVRLGSVTGALSTVANLTTWVPEGAALDLPFIFSGRDHIAAALGGPLGERLRAAYREAGFEVPAFIVFGARHLIGEKAFVVPGEVSGLTMRVLQSDLHIALWRFLGANPTALAITEAYSALSTGVVDAMDMTMSGYEALKLYEAAPVLSETAHIYAVGVVYFDAAFWEGLPDEERTLLQRAAVEAAAYFDSLTMLEQEEAMARAAEKGAQRAKVEASVWRNAATPFVEEYVARHPELAEPVAAIEASR